MKRDDQGCIFSLTLVNEECSLRHATSRDYFINKAQFFTLHFPVTRRNNFYQNAEGRPTNSSFFLLSYSRLTSAAMGRRVRCIHIFSFLLTQAVKSLRDRPFIVTICSQATCFDTINARCTKLHLVRTKIRPKRQFYRWIDSLATKQRSADSSSDRNPMTITKTGHKLNPLPIVSITDVGISHRSRGWSCRIWITRCSMR